ncbi:FixH family protein [Hufsiella ginkgonis]|uniref:Nitrogen fixation protein FixH n=1 Tax=Hufsiella ginkgonis TaxID=2695274 RepID=A0A7K1Y0E2_9SPHI|nr:FixH family protein [Hufsiella ginkgonis]MXV16744.1 hypothetical protein [Hufsiella ginkgonis]
MSWGTKLAIGLTVFIVFILSMGTRMLVGGKDDLVEKDYYEKGQSYDSDYREQQNALDQAKLPAVTSGAKGIRVTFTETVPYTLICRHPFNSARDFTLANVAEAGIPVTIPAHRLAPGNWNLEIRWTDHGIAQKLKQQMTIK